MRVGFIAVLFIAGLSAAPALAQTAGAREAQMREQLKAAEQKASEAQAVEQELSGRALAMRKELTELQEQLSALTDNMQKHEQSLFDAQEKLTILLAEQKQKDAELATRRAQLSAMLQAAVRLSRTPPEAAIMMPGDFKQTLMAARVLSTLSESIRTESESVKAQLVELAEIRKKVERSKSDVSDSIKELKPQIVELDAKVAERKTLFAALSREQDIARRTAQELAKETGNLKELVASLEQSRKTQAEQEKKLAEEKKKTLPKAQSGDMRSFASAKGKMRQPAAGKVRTRYGQELGRNETSRGIKLRTRAKAGVVAPYDGEVVFTGPFLDYGSMVILRHRDEFHTLLAGLDAIDVSVGQFLLEGEPIGAMGSKAADAELYVELRKNNQPIDPAPWIPGLK